MAPSCDCVSSTRLVAYSAQYTACPEGKKREGNAYGHSKKEEERARKRRRRWCWWWLEGDHDEEVMEVVEMVAEE